MLRKCVLVLVIASAALLTFAVDVAHAQGLRARRMNRNGNVYPADNYFYNQQQQQAMYPSIQPVSMSGRVSFYPANPALNNGAQIRVLLPDPQAKVTFDGKSTNSTGNDRLFLTPALAQGGPSTYVIRVTFMANGQEMTREQTLNAAPNMSYLVDFNRN
jgi:uncharacterized protein (TIGR03000 family)